MKLDMTPKETEHICPDCQNNLVEPFTFLHIYDATELYCNICEHWYMLYWRTGTIKRK